MSDKKDTEVIKDILQTIDNTLNLKKQNMKYEKFKSCYSKKKIEEISWIKLCDDVVEYDCYKYGLFFIHFMLTRGIYTGDHKEKLYSLNPLFKITLNFISAFYSNIFCGHDIESFFIIQNDNYEYNLYYHLFFNNTLLQNVYMNFLSNANNVQTNHDLDFCKKFEKSLGSYSKDITSYKDFNGYTFWEQADYFKKCYNENIELQKKSLRAICEFYRWLHNKYPDHNFFESSLNISSQLLFSKAFINLISEDYYFTTYNPNNHPGDIKKIVFILRGFDKYSTILRNVDYTKLDLSSLSSSYYRKAFITHLLSSKNISILTNSQFYNTVKALEFIFKLKQNPNYPNPSLKYLNNQEAILIKKFFDDKSLSLATRNTKIGAIRRFLLWAKKTKKIDFDDMFFDYMRQFEEPSYTTGNAIPEDKLIKLNNYIINDFDKNPVARLHHVLFHLALQTEFRISQICHLTTDCIRPSIKPDQYVLYTNSKTSKGIKNKCVITNLTYHLILSAIEYTEKTREISTINNLKKYIFIYPGDNYTIKLIDAYAFRSYMRKVSKYLNFDAVYGAKRLRDTHMTKSFEHILRNNKSNLELKVLSKHKHIDTTKNHYIEIELEKMLEATYGITISGDNLIDFDSKVVDKIPVNNKESIVENGCGNCTAKKCVLTSSLPCLACENFITTVKHEKYFIKAIENVDNLISKSNTIHDKEDLLTIKKLHVFYLKAICIHKEVDCL